MGEPKPVLQFCDNRNGRGCVGGGGGCCEGDGSEGDRTMGKRVGAPRGQLEGPAAPAGLRQTGDWTEGTVRTGATGQRQEEGVPGTLPGALHAGLPTESRQPGGRTLPVLPCPPQPPSLSGPRAGAQESAGSASHTPGWGSQADPRTPLAAAWASGHSALVPAWHRSAPVPQSEVMPGPELLGRGMKP